jgi:hypothetical protein
VIVAGYGGAKVATPRKSSRSSLEGAVASEATGDCRSAKRLGDDDKDVVVSKERWVIIVWESEEEATKLRAVVKVHT